MFNWAYVTKSGARYTFDLHSGFWWYASRGEMNRYRDGPHRIWWLKTLSRGSDLPVISNKPRITERIYVGSNDYWRLSSAVVLMYPVVNWKRVKAGFRGRIGRIKREMRNI